MISGMDWYHVSSWRFSSEQILIMDGTGISIALAVTTDPVEEFELNALGRLVC